MHRGKSLMVTDEIARCSIRSAAPRSSAWKPPPRTGRCSSVTWPSRAVHTRRSPDGAVPQAQGAEGIRHRWSGAVRSCPVRSCTRRATDTPIRRELARWDQVHSGSGDVGVHLHHSLANLLVAAVSAAVVAPEKELKRWFSWQWYWDDAHRGQARRGRSAPARRRSRHGSVALTTRMSGVPSCHSITFTAAWRWSSRNTASPGRRSHAARAARIAPA